jgi:hypothetical protein
VIQFLISRGHAYSFFDRRAHVGDNQTSTLDYTDCELAIGLLGDIRAAKSRQNMEQKEVSRW